MAKKDVCILLLDLIRDVLSGRSVDFLTIVVSIFSSLAVVFLTMPVHEFAHAYVADKLGDPTPRYTGRLTLNPLKHIDYMGAAFIILFGFGWAKPVQVNTRYFQNPKRDMAITAVAGPISNILMCFIILLIRNIFLLLPDSQVIYIIALFLTYIAYINVYLAIFNLIPVPPLDGSRLLSAFLPYKYYYALMRYERYIFYGIMLLLWTGVLSAPITLATEKVINAISLVAALPFNFF